MSILCVSLFVHWNAHAGAGGGQKRVSDPQEMELQAVVSYLMHSGKAAASTVNPQAIQSESLKWKILETNSS